MECTAFLSGVRSLKKGRAGQKRMRLHFPRISQVAQIQWKALHQLLHLSPPAASMFFFLQRILISSSFQSAYRAQQIRGICEVCGRLIPAQEVVTKNAVRCVGDWSALQVPMKRTPLADAVRCRTGGSVVRGKGVACARGVTGGCGGLECRKPRLWGRGLSVVACGRMCRGGACAVATKWQGADPSRRLCSA